MMSLQRYKKAKAGEENDFFSHILNWENTTKVSWRWLNDQPTNFQQWSVNFSTEIKPGGGKVAVVVVAEIEKEEFREKNLVNSPWKNIHQYPNRHSLFTETAVLLRVPFKKIFMKIINIIQQQQPPLYKFLASAGLPPPHWWKNPISFQGSKNTIYMSSCNSLRSWSCSEFGDGRGVNNRKTERRKK